MSSLNDLGPLPVPLVRLPRSAGAAVSATPSTAPTFVTFSDSLGWFDHDARTEEVQPDVVVPPRQPWWSAALLVVGGASLGLGLAGTLFVGGLLLGWLSR